MGSEMCIRDRAQEALDRRLGVEGVGARGEARHGLAVPIDDKLFIVPGDVILLVVPLRLVLAEREGFDRAWPVDVDLVEHWKRAGR